MDKTQEKDQLEKRIRLMMDRRKFQTKALEKLLNNLKDNDSKGLKK